MALYGYARVSTLDQDLTVQEQALRVAGCDVIRAERGGIVARRGHRPVPPEALVALRRRLDTLPARV